MTVREPVPNGQRMMGDKIDDSLRRAMCEILRATDRTLSPEFREQAAAQIEMMAFEMTRAADIIASLSRRTHELEAMAMNLQETLAAIRARAAIDKEER